MKCQIPHQWRDAIIYEASRILAGKGKKGTAPELCDGKTAERIVEVLTKKTI